MSGTPARPGRKERSRFRFPARPKKIGSKEFTRQLVQGEFTGCEIKGNESAYALGVVNEGKARIGGELGRNGAAWAAIGKGLPQAASTDAGASVAVDFVLAPGAESVVRFVLAWHAPKWNGVGRPRRDKVYKGYSGEPRAFAHMYAKFYPDAVGTAQLVAKHAALLGRVLAWQQVIYSENKLPVWLRDSLINVLYMITEDGYWARKQPPLPSWVREEDGLFGMNECPRGCPQIECIPCSFYGSLPLAYFFPELELSTLRGYKAISFPTAVPTWIFGGCTGHTPYIDFAYPTRGYQFATNGISLAALVDRFLLCQDTPDKKYLHEFYPMVKKCMEWTVKLRTTPEYGIGDRIISMPDKNEGTEWFEARRAGLVRHDGPRRGPSSGSVAHYRADGQGSGRRRVRGAVREWIKAGQEAMEKRLWDDRGFYLNYSEPETKRRSNLVFGYQLDGEWITDHHGLAPALPADRIRKVLDTIKRCNIAVTKYGAVNYANADGTPAGVKGYGTYSYFPPEALMLAMTYMYKGQTEFGVELARKVWHNLVCLQGYTWDMPNIMRGDVDTGERTFGNDYYQDMMLWSLPAALEGHELDAPTKPGGLVNRVIAAAKGL